MKTQAHDLKKQLSSGDKLLIIDLRPTIDFQKETVPSAISLPFSEGLLLKINQSFNKDEKIILFCENEFLSAETYLKLIEDGFLKVSILSQGFLGWKSFETEMKFHRQMILPGFGNMTQKRLSDASVLFVGAGAVSSTCIAYLSAAGIGRIGVIDHDTVDETNLHRQIIHNSKNIGVHKTDSTKLFIESLNPDVLINTYPFSLSLENAEEIIQKYEVIVDGSDNFQTKYLVNQVCIKLQKKFIIGSVQIFEGQVFSFFDQTHSSGCFQCLFPEPPDRELRMTCGENGVLGTVTGMVGILEANEVLFYFMNLKNLKNKFINFDMYKYAINEFTIPKSKTCTVCNNPS